MARSTKDEISNFFDRYWKIFSKYSTQVLIYQKMLERIVAESPDPVAKRLATNALHAGAICKTDEVGALELLNGGVE